MLGKKIVSFGEILFDVYDKRESIGGAPFNFLYHIHKLGFDTALISRVGLDKHGEEILSFLNSKGFPNNFIQVDKHHPTGSVNVSLDKKKIPTFEIVENQSYDYIEYTSSLDQLMNNCSLLYFGTLAQRKEVSRNTLYSLFNTGVKLFCDINLRQGFYSRGIIHQSLQAANVLKISIYELKLINEFLIGQNFETEKTALYLLRNFNIEMLCVTLGSDGAILFNEIEKQYLPIYPGNIVDTTGAGDAFAAILCLGYLKNWPLDKINRRANRFASDICGIDGAIPIDDKFYDKYISEFENE